MSPTPNHLDRRSVSRRTFLRTAASGAAGATALASSATVLDASDSTSAQTSARPRAATEPWLEIDARVIADNISTIATLAGGRPVIAVAKNNAYGLGIAEAGPILDRHRQVETVAVVRVDEALGLRAAGVRKPVLLMARPDMAQLAHLAARDITLTPDEAMLDDLLRVARRGGRPLAIHLYVDTGMHRMGMPVDRLPGVLNRLAGSRELRVRGIFTELTEDLDFDRSQCERLHAVAAVARGRGMDVGRLHAASSHAVWHIPESHLDAVRPGIAVYGGWVSAEAERQGGLRPAYRLRAPVVRVQRLEAGEGVSYHRRWKAAEPTWIATLPVGHVDGYPSGIVKGGEVLIDGHRYPVIGTVSASHTLVALGAETAVKPGDVATLVGPDDAAIHPNEVARRASWSEYNMFMHLNPLLGRVVVNASQR
ncbi:MAG: alanine racemase [Gemmatimonadaceae bacterium]